jgi:uncharacterized membrane protein
MSRFAYRTFNWLLLSTLALSPFGVYAQGEATAYEEWRETVPAKVVEILDDTERELPGLSTTIRIQTLRAEILAGERIGATVLFDNEFAPVAVGDRVFVNRLVTIQGVEYFVIKDVDRRTELLVLGFMFVLLVLSFAGWQGIRALGSLAVSIGAIIFLLLPALLAGYNPALASLVIAGVILALVLYGTHGFNPISTISFLGTFAAVMITCGVAYFFVGAMRFTGVSSDEAVFLNFATGGSLDFAGLLLGSIIIGALGVLDDISITQASVVRELKAVNPTLTAFQLYQSAIKVGRDHVGSLVNTLALAYVGASLPLMLLLYRAETSISLTLNQELVAVEIARIIIGSIGIILAVPMTTALGAWYYAKREVDLDEEDEHHGHSHGHGHTHAHSHQH